MNAIKAIKAAIAVGMVVALVASGQGAYRPRAAIQTEPAAVAVVL